MSWQQWGFANQIKIRRGYEPIMMVTAFREVLSDYRCRLDCLEIDASRNSRRFSTNHKLCFRGFIISVSDRTCYNCIFHPNVLLDEIFEPISGYVCMLWKGNTETIWTEKICVWQALCGQWSLQEQSRDYRLRIYAWHKIEQHYLRSVNVASHRTGYRRDTGTGYMRDIVKKVSPS